MQWMCPLFLLLLPALATATGAPMATHELNVGGTLEIDPDGAVRSYELKPEPSPVVAALIKKAVTQWRFVPITDQSKPVIARTQMDLQLEATPVGNAYSVTLKHVNFGQPLRIPGGALPSYPRTAEEIGLSARVTLALLIDANGKVSKVAVVQTSLGGTTSSERAADDWRRLFEETSLDVVRRWRYNLTEIIGAKPTGIRAYAPILFQIVHSKNQWNAFVPGPIHVIPWFNNSASLQADASHLRDGQAVALDSRFKLQSDVIGKTL